MKKLLTLLIVLSFMLINAEEKFIKLNDGIYKLVLDEKGDTLSMEKINVLDELEAPNLINEIETDTLIVDEEIAEYEYDPQWLKSIIPYRWQVGLYGLSRGPAYGAALSYSFIPDDLGGIPPDDSFAVMSSTKEKIVVFSAMTMPLVMFLAPPLLLNDDISPISIPIIDMGYILGPMDYFAIRLLAAAGNDMKQYEPGLAAVMGYTEAWGGYFLLQHLGEFNRAAGHFYNAGAFLGYIWGGLQGMYIADKAFGSDLSTVTANKKIRLGSSIALAYSIGLRSLGFYMGNNDNYRWRSFDAWVIAANTLPGMMMGMEIINQTNMDIEGTLLLSGMGMASSALTGYLIRNTHFDDANAILMLVGGGLGALVGNGVNVFLGDYYPSVQAMGMVAGELAVYYLRRHSIGDQLTSHIPQNMYLGFYPVENNGLGANLSINF